MKITKFAPHHPEALASTLTLGSPAGGDLSGSLPGPTVAAIQGVPVASTAPATGQILYFDGTSWTPVAIAREGTHAARPAAAAGNTGWLYHETDTNGELFISTGAAWDRVAAGSIAVVASGLTGATAASRYAGATTSGAPASGTFAKGDFIIDQTGAIYICTTAGSPGTWTSAAGTFSLEVKEIDGAPDVTGVSVIQVSNGTLTDNGGGNVTINTSGSGGGLSQSYVGYNTAGATPGVFATDSTTFYAKKITLSSTSVVLGIGAYIDMHTQAGSMFQVAIYADSSGSPTDVIAIGGTTGVAGSGSLYLGTHTDTPQWLDFPIGGVSLAAGDYWFCFGGEYQSLSWRIYHDGSGSDGIITQSTAGYILPVAASNATFASGSNKYSIRVSILS